MPLELNYEVFRSSVKISFGGKIIVIPKKLLKKAIFIVRGRNSDSYLKIKAKGLSFVLKLPQTAPDEVFAIVNNIIDDLVVVLNKFN